MGQNVRAVRCLRKSQDGSLTLAEGSFDSVGLNGFAEGERGIAGSAS